MPRRMTADLRIAVPPLLRKRLETEALRHQRSLSSMTRILLEQALCVSERSPEPQSEYEIRLRDTEAAELQQRGFKLTPAGDGKNE